MTRTRVGAGGGLVGRDLAAFGLVQHLQPQRLGLRLDDRQRAEQLTQLVAGHPLERDLVGLGHQGARRRHRGDARLVSGDAVGEIARLRAEDGAPMEIGGAALASAAMRAGLVDEYQVVTHLVLVGGGTPLFGALDSPVALRLVGTRTSTGGVVMAHYEVRR